jgi:endonuclease YncB( thermonuclease family)
VIRFRSTTFLLLLLVGCAPAPNAERLEGRVTRVWDGDTVTLRVAGTDHRVRLAGIDAPEHDQPFGDAARQRLTALALDAEARLEMDKTDKYDRLVGKLWVQPADCPKCGRTLDVSMAMLSVGLAWWYRYYADEQSPEDRGRYEFAEAEARAKRVGLWQDANPTPPWDWPRGDRRASTPRDGCDIKGNISGNGRIYHVPGQEHYDRTRIDTGQGERWFCSEAQAKAAGWRPARR